MLEGITLNFLNLLFHRIKILSYLIRNISLRFPSRNIINVILFFVAWQDCPSARCATAASLISSDRAIFIQQIRTLKQILC